MERPSGKVGHSYPGVNTLGEGCFCKSNFRTRDTTMAKASIALSELVEKGAKDDIVRELLGHVAERLMVRDRTTLRRRVWRAQRRSQQQPQRLSRPFMGNARRCDRASHSEAAQRQLSSSVARASANGRESAGRRRARSVHPRRLDALRRRARASDGHDRHLEEPGVAVMR